jgi:hypothetical protein
MDQAFCLLIVTAMYSLLGRSSQGSKSSTAQALPLNFAAIPVLPRGLYSFWEIVRFLLTFALKAHRISVFRLACRGCSMTLGAACRVGKSESPRRGRNLTFYWCKFISRTRHYSYGKATRKS